MRKFKFNTNKIEIIGTSLMAFTMLVNGCSTEKTNESILNSETLHSSEVTSESVTESAALTEPTTTAPNYDFAWNDEAAEAFSNYFDGKFGFYNLVSYINVFGFTDELNQIFTEFVNMYYDRDYDYVPFDRVKHFNALIVVNKEDRDVYDSYDNFNNAVVNLQYTNYGPFNNKLLLSYLIANNITFGEMVPIENIKALLGDEIYDFGCKSYYIENPHIPNNDNLENSNAKDLAAIIEIYNSKISMLCTDKRIIDRNINAHPEVYELYNEHLSRFYEESYGSEVYPKFNEQLSREQYIQIFGEEPLDLSYIPGAVVKDTEVKGSSKARYNDDINNYDVSYIPGYEYYIEETESTRSR